MGSILIWEFKKSFRNSYRTQRTFLKLDRLLYPIWKMRVPSITILTIHASSYFFIRGVSLSGRTFFFLKFLRQQMSFFNKFLMLSFQVSNDLFGTF